MADNNPNFLQRNWKAIVWGLTPIVIIVIVFALPLKTVPVQVTEKYWDTEIKQQPYTVSESYTDTEPYTTTEKKTESIYDSYVNASNWSHVVNVDKPGSTVTIKLESHYPNYPWYYSINCPGGDSVCRTWPYNYWNYGGQSKITIELSYPTEVTKYRTVTKYRDVTKFRDVPTQVQKERTVTKYHKMSIWGYLFR